MLEFMKTFYDTMTSGDWHWDIVAVDLVAIAALLLVFKFTLGIYSGLNVRHEIAEKDNPAFGVVLGFMLFSFLLVMSAASTGSEILSYGDEFLNMFVFGLSGMIMLFLSKIIFDKLSMTSFSITEELKKENMAVAIVSSGNILSSALIIYAYMGWVKGTSFDIIILVAIGWFISQALLSAITFARTKMYKSYDGETLIDSIKSGNVATAFRFSAYRLAFAMTPMLVIPHYQFDSEDAYYQVAEIFATSLFFYMLFMIVAVVSTKIVFPKVDFKDEINRQKNIGVSVIQSLMILGYAILLYGIMKP